MQSARAMHAAEGKLDGVLALGLGACAGALAGSAPGAAGLATAIVLVGFARAGPYRSGARENGSSRAYARVRLVRALVALAAAFSFFVSAARADRAVRSFERAREAVVRDGAWPARCVVVGRVVASPVRAGDALRVDVAVGEKDGSCERGAFGGRVALHVPSALTTSGSPLARGDRVRAIAQLAPPYRFWNDGTGDPRPAQARKGALLSGGVEDLVVLTKGRGLLALIDRVRGVSRERIDATFPPETAAMARALVLGEDDLAEGDQRAFRRSGLAHLLAVSGMHLVLVVAGLVACLRAVFVRIPAVAARVDANRVAAAIGLPITWIYADLAGGSGSAVRAAWMTSAGLLAHVLARRPATWRALGISVLAMTIVDPLVAFDLSFVLSAAATLGIVALSPRLEAGARARLPSWAASLVRPVATTASATIACAPVLACMSGDLPVAGLVANLVAVPIGDVAALPLCLLHALLEPLPLAERGCAIAASGALVIVRGVARAFSAIPWGAAPVPPPTPGQLAALAVLAFGFSGLVTRRALAKKLWIGAALAAFVALEVSARARGSPRGLLRVTFLDVGQGDAALVDLPDGSAMLIDAGGLVGSPIDTGERAVAPVLRARRRRAVDVVVLSHPHPDHFGGMRTGLDGVRVGAMWDTGQGEAESAGGAYAEILAKLRARGVRVERPRDLCGTHAIGGAIVEVLAPCPGLSPDDGPNDNSFVVRIRHGSRAILFAGDAERTEEHDVLAARGASLRSDVLKVGHHGSRTSSTPAWLAAVSPSIAVISCGVRNRFGHPHRTTLASLAAAGARIYRTDRDGAVVVTTDGRSLDVSTAQERSTTPMYGRFL